MDDVHFFLRHAMTGAVFVIFTALGLAFLGGSILDLMPADRRGDWPVALAALAIIGFPMIGITIQGSHYCFYVIRPYVTHAIRWMAGRPKVNRWQGELFTDPARRWVAETVRAAIKNCEKAACSEVPINWRDLDGAPDDVFFVWLYHDRAPPQMIEWARRRRSYYYLGVNWVIAASTGAGAAYLVSNVSDNWHDRWLITLSLVFVWVMGAIVAAGRMRRDANTMEAIWAASQINPEFRDCLSKSLPLSARSMRNQDLP